MPVAYRPQHRRRMAVPLPVIDGTPVSLGTTSTHDAFPGVCRVATGSDDLICVYRQASDHGTIFDGILRKRTSSDNGATWTDPPVTIWNPSPHSAGGCTLLKLANDDLMVTTWRRSTAPDWDPYVILSTDDGSTWGSPILVTNSFTDWAIAEGNAVQTDNGDLYVSMYGADSGDTFASVRISKSTDGGATWAHFTEVVNGDTFGRDMQEPQMVILDTGVWLCLIRSDTGTPTSGSIYYSLSYDLGVSWSTPQSSSAGTGRPTVLQRTSDGRVFHSFRTNSITGIDGTPKMKSSNDGIDWNQFMWGDFTNGTTLYYAYGQFVELDTGELAIVYSLQAAGGDVDAALWFSRITD